MEDNSEQLHSQFMDELANDQSLAMSRIDPQRDSGDGVEDVGTPPVSGGSAAVSRLQITRSPPFSYDGTTLTDNDFFVSFGLYNGEVPTAIDDKITVTGTATTYVYLEITVSITNPAYAASIAIGTAATRPSNTPAADGEWPGTVYINLGQIEDDAGTWRIVNNGNGNVGGSIYVSRYNIDSAGVVDVSYAFSYSRF